MNVKLSHEVLTLRLHVAGFSFLRPAAREPFQRRFGFALVSLHEVGESARPIPRDVGIGSREVDAACRPALDPLMPSRGWLPAPWLEVLY